jgi:hypothetical protein
VDVNPCGKKLPVKTPSGRSSERNITLPSKKQPNLNAPTSCRYDRTDDYSVRQKVAMGKTYLSFRVCKGIEVAPPQTPSATEAGKMNA